MATKAPPKSAPDQPDEPDRPDAVAPAVAEVEDTPLEVEYGGHTYIIERDAFTSIKFLKAVEQDKSFSMIEALLGERQYALFESRHPQAAEFNDFVEAFSTRVGSGNS